MSIVSCPACKESIDADSTFCKHCGLNLSSEGASSKQVLTKESSQSAPERRTSKGTLFILALLIVTVLAIALFQMRRIALRSQHEREFTQTALNSSRQAGTGLPSSFAKKFAGSILEEREFVNADTGKLQKDTHELKVVMSLCRNGSTLSGDTHYPQGGEGGDLNYRLSGSIENDSNLKFAETQVGGNYQIQWEGRFVSLTEIEARTLGDAHATIRVKEIVESAGNDASQLTQARAERAIKEWTKKYDSISVIGIQTTNKSAKADFSFKNVPLNIDLGRQQVLSGTGHAAFVRYDDGRWFLKQILFGNDALFSPHAEMTVEVR